MKNRVKTHLTQARQHATQGNRDQALLSIKKALAADPGEILITEVLISMERADSVHEQQANSDEINIPVLYPTTERNKTADMDSKLEKIFKLSDEALAAGNDAKALAYVKKAVQLFPDEQLAKDKLQDLKNTFKAENLVTIGVKKLSAGETQKAIVASRKAFTLSPRVKGLNELLASIEAAQTITSEPEPEIEIEETIIQEPTKDDSEEQNPIGEALLWADRIRTAVKDDNFEEAGKMVAEAVRRHPDDPLLDSFYSKLKRLGFVKT